MTLLDIAKIWRKEHAPFVKESTINAEWQKVIHHLAPYFGDVESIKEDDVQKFIDGMSSSGYSAHTIRDTVMVLKMLIKFGARNKWCENPVEWKFKYPADSRSSKNLQCWALPYQRKMINYLKEHFNFRNLGLLITMETGMRIGEIAGLRWGDFDMENKVVCIRRIISRIYCYDDSGKACGTKVIVGSTKTVNSEREIPLSDDLLKFVRPLVKICEPDNYVTSNASTPCEPRTYRKYFIALCQEVGVPRIKFHGLRHTFATSLISAKCDVKTVSSLLGHADVSTTLNTYVHPSMDQKKGAIQAMLRRVRRKEANEEFDVSSYVKQ